MANPHVILQWNCRGLKDKREELELLIAHYSPAVICLQETLLNPEIEKCQEAKKPLPSFVQFKGYKSYFKCIESGRNGVAIYVKNSVFHTPIRLKGRWQALAVRITYQGKEFIVSNHYTPGSRQSPYPKEKDFQYIVNQFDKPYIMCGDFNAKNTLWSAREDDDRGRAIEEFMFKNDLGLLNSDIKTHWDEAAKSWSLLDLSIAHPSLYLDFDSEIVSDLHGSDHSPIILKLNTDLFEVDKRPRWNFKKANWGSFKIQCRNEINEELLENQEDKIKVITEKILEIAADNIPKTSPFHNKHSKPWFDDECKAAKRERNKANRLNRRYPCLDNAIKAKVANARARRTFKRKKRESWRNYVSSINSRTPTSKVWNMIRKITGKNSSHLLHIKDDRGNLLTDKMNIADRIGSTFSKNSSASNYSDRFQSEKVKAERNPIDFNTSENLPYNKRFKLRDLKRAIKKSKDTTPGPDNIHYKILKNLPTEILNILLNIINDHWDSHTFPESWREALLLPIPKPGKDHQDPSNFRPIALTSCLCKTVERMVNERLIYYLEKKNLLTKFQAGFRAERSTIDQLVRLESFIKDAFAEGDHVVGVFFDLAKAYDTTWKYGILKDLYDFELRGNLPIFIKNFLSDRTFQILLCNTLSPKQFTQEEGVPQGAILSTTLFNVKLNGIVKVIDKDVECSLYVDDFVIFFRSRTVRNIERKLQNNIRYIQEWTLKNGFTVSPEPNKTVAMHFCKCNKRFCPNPQLKLGNHPINVVTEHKFLGIIWDPKLTFRAHIEYLRKKCLSALKPIGVLAHSNWGSDTKTLLKLFRSLVRSKLDYGSIVYRSADHKLLEKLNVIHRHGLRLCLGAFKSSPIESLYVEANEPPLELRRQELSMRYSLKIKSNPDNPVYDAIFKDRDRVNYECLGMCIDRLFNDASIDINSIMTKQMPKVPLYESDPNDVNFKLTVYDKSTTNPEVFRSKFLEIKPEYDGYIHLYTDGSKQDERAAFGLSDGDRWVSERIPNFCEYFYCRTSGH